MKKTTKFSKIFRVTKYAALSIVVVAAALWVYLRFFVRDIPHIDDSALTRETTKVPPSKNGFLLLAQAEVLMNLKAFKYEFVRIGTIGHELDNTGRLSDASMQEAMFLFKDRLGAMERAAELPYSQAPEIPYMDTDTTVPHHYNPLSIRYLSMIKLEIARRDFEAGRQEQALEGIKKVMDIGRIEAMEQGGGSLINLMMSTSIKQSAVEALNSMIAQGYFLEDVSGLNAFLGGRDISADAIRNAFKGEYRNMSGVLNTANSRDIYRFLFNHDEHAPYTSGIFGSFFGRFFESFLFQKERTRKMIFDYHAKLIEDAGKPYSEWFKWVNSGVMLRFPDSSETLPLIFRGEYGARMYIYLGCPSLRNGVARIYYTNFAIQATRLRLAALTFKRDKGALPRTLGELVPAYIDRVPADPFDGKPIRYNPDKKIIYSVGTDAKDDGGAAAKRMFSDKPFEIFSKEKDLVLGI